MTEGLVLWIYFVAVLLAILLYSSFSTDQSIFIYVLAIVFIIILACKAIQWLYNPEQKHVWTRNPYKLKNFTLFNHNKEPNYTNFNFQEDDFDYDIQGSQDDMQTNTQSCSKRDFFFYPQNSTQITNRWNAKPNSITHRKFKQNENPFESIHIWEPDNFQQIQWADSEYFKLNMKLQDAKRLVYKIRDFFRSKFQEYDQEQRMKFSQLVTLGNLLFNLPNNSSRNNYYLAICRVLKQYKKTDRILLSTSCEQKERLSRRQFTEKLSKLQLIIQTMTFPKFLQSNSKADMIEFYAWVLRNQIFTKTIINIVVTLTKIRPSFKNLQLTLFFIPRTNFCYVSYDQSNHCLNLQETALIAILHSQQYRSNPQMLRRILQ